MMNDPGLMAAGLPAEMELLVFRAAGVTIAAETVQVDCIMSPQQARQHGISPGTLNEILGLKEETSSASSTVLLYRNEGRACGLGIDALDAIITIPITAIQPLPEPLSYFAGPRIFWGAVLRESNVVLLIDLSRLRGLKACKAAATA